MKWTTPQLRARIGSASAALASVVIHALLVKGLILAEGGRVAHRAHHEGLGANAIASGDEPSATMIFIETLDAPGDAAAPDLSASYGSVPESLQLTVITPEPTLDLALESSDLESDSSEAVADSAGDRHKRAAMFGVYLAQIEARISRAWRRPRAPIGAASFECHVQVTQSERGEVREVSLQQCNGDARWQLSLVQAVERASPLPAPPDPAVFAESLQLSFHSAAFEPGSREGDFEPAPDARAHNILTGQWGP